MAKGQHFVNGEDMAQLNEESRVRKEKIRLKKIQMHEESLEQPQENVYETRSI